MKRAGGDFFAPASAKAPRTGASWRVVTESASTYLLRTDTASAPSAKIAAFDMDGTLVVTKSGSKFASSADDWQLLHEECGAALRSLHAAGYRIVVFSNQGGIKSAVDGKRAGYVKGYFDSAFAKIGVPVTALVAPGKDAFRKPEVGMWRALCAMNGGVKPDLAASFFVGDAAGRPADHSDCDSAFAKAVGLPFFLPEAAFPVASWAPLVAARALTAAAAQPEEAAAPAQAEDAAAPAQPAEEAVPAAAAEVIVLE